MTPTLDTVRRVHFIGIGGIGISAIARMFLARGVRVTGSDRAGGDVVTELKRLGARIASPGHRATNVPRSAELVIYTVAIPPTNPELRRARTLHLPLLSYPEALGVLSAAHDTVAVSGTHGKTTTTAMLAKICLDAGRDPTVVVGSLLRDHHSNFIAGRSSLFIAEACEYRRSFLNLSPRGLIITNIEAEHLDYYKDLADIQEAFRTLVAKLPPDGFIVVNPKDARVRPVLRGAPCRIIDYTKVSLRGVKLQTPGAHNRVDAQAALAAAQALGIPRGQAVPALGHFRGTWRRFEPKGTTQRGATVYSDYAHHPTEIAATLQGAREIAGQGRIIVAFQPHLYSRTKLLLKDFARAFRNADQVFLDDIYAAREPNDPTITSQKLAATMAAAGGSVCYEPHWKRLAAALLAAAAPGDLIIVMGAGDIYTLAETLVRKK